MSEHKNIVAALAAAQSQMGKALKDAENPHFRSKYADLASVMGACMPALNANGIAVIQPVVETEFGRAVSTRFLHGSGDSLECNVPLIVQKNDMQGLGSAVTYARRYGLMSLAGIAPEDDDGNAAVAAAPQSNASREGLRDAWRDAVLDSLPANASEEDKAQAFAEAIRDDFRDKGEKALQNAWGRHEKMIARFETKWPDLFSAIVETYEGEMRRATGTDASFAAQ